MIKVLASSFVVAVVALLPGAWGAEALTIGPGDAAFSGRTTPPSDPGMLAEANDACNNCLTTEVYNSDGDSGVLGGSYTWTTAGEHGGTLHYDGGSIFSSGYLFVKDGMADPNWFVFNLTSLGWNGMVDLVLQGLFVADASNEQNGGISHIVLYGSTSTTPPPTTVPEPATLSMLGLGLTGAGLARRRSKKKALA